MSRTFELSLKSLSIEENGDIRKKTASNGLVVSLVYPTPGKPVVTTVKELRLTDDQVIDFDQGVNPGTGQPYTWSERILLKEEIEGSSYLIVELTDVEELGKLDRFMAALFKNVFKAAWGLFTEGIGNVLLGAVSESIGAAHLESFDVKGEKVNIIGKAELVLDGAALPAAGSASDIELDLIVPKKVETTVAVFDPNTHKPVRTKKTVLAKGAQNGEVVLTLKAL